jgi:HSP20 family protein
MASMMQWSPAPQFRTLRSEMDRLFDDFFGLTPAKREGAVSLWAPAVDVREDANNYYVEAALPGMKKEEISLELENNVLSIKGERKFERKEDKQNYHFMERSYGSFYRSFSLPKNIDAEKISAEYKEGVLNVTLPKKPEVKPKKVEIKI